MRHSSQRPGMVKLGEKCTGTVRNREVIVNKVGLLTANWQSDPDELEFHSPRACGQLFLASGRSESEQHTLRDSISQLRTV